MGGGISMDWLRKKAARLGVEFRNASLTKSLFFIWQQEESFAYIDVAGLCGTDNRKGKA